MVNNCLGLNWCFGINRFTFLYLVTVEPIITNGFSVWCSVFCTKSGVKISYHYKGPLQFWKPASWNKSHLKPFSFYQTCFRLTWKSFSCHLYAMFLSTIRFSASSLNQISVRIIALTSASETDLIFFSFFSLAPSFTHSFRCSTNWCRWFVSLCPCSSNTLRLFGSKNLRNKSVGFIPTDYREVMGLVCVSYCVCQRTDESIN